MVADPVGGRDRRSFTTGLTTCRITLRSVASANPDTIIGRLIDGRYQVRSLIARGGMATVYVATDLRLERRVAVKIMHDHLAADEAFRARFIREARAAAKLAHPNLVNVYDQGEDNGLAYMVMEYVPGITLRDLLHDHHRLTVEQTIDIMDAVLAGLQVAHRQGIVHRDIKPENVLLADDGRIKLSDFGLARAATSNTASGSVLLGTIAYLAPELVTKGTADVRSDIYSAGIMMFEMLAGEQPYRGDEPVNIAYRHANDNVPPPSELQADVPQELDDLVIWSTERDPEDRPADAGGMLAALRQAERDIAAGGGTRVPPNSASLPVAPDPSTRLLAVADDEPDSWELPTQASDFVELQAAATQASAPAHPDVLVPKPAGFAPVAVSGLPPTANRLERINRQKRRSGFVAAIVVAMLVAIATGIGWWQGVGPGSYDPSPQLAGLAQAEAESTITAAGFTLGEVIGENSLEVPSGVVIRSDPDGGMPLAPDSAIDLVVSTGPRILTVPAVAGLDRDAAIEAIAQAGFNYDPETDRSQFSGEPAGTVLYGTTSSGESLPQELAEQEHIRLVLSLGPVPDVEGMSEGDAVATLANAGLTGVVVDSTYSKTTPAGAVLSQSTTSDPVVQGDEIHLVTSLGPDLVEVPNVVGKPLKEAIATLESAGFTVTHEVPSYLQDIALVLRTEPAAGEKIDRGASVRVIVTVTV